jgi:hypothetical protein
MASARRTAAPLGALAAAPVEGEESAKRADASGGLSNQAATTLAFGGRPATRQRPNRGVYASVLLKLGDCRNVRVKLLAQPSVYASASLK